MPVDNLISEDYLTGKNAREADILLAEAKAVERKADALNLTKDARDAMYARALQIRDSAYSLMGK